MANKNSMLRFKWVNRYVNDLNESILYYKKLNFTVTWVDTHDVFVKPSEDSGLTIRLMCAHEYKQEPGSCSFEFEADLDNGYSHSMVSEELAIRGVKCSGVEPHEVLSGVIYHRGQFVDPDGCQIELVMPDRQ